RRVVVHPEWFHPTGPLRLGIHRAARYPRRRVPNLGPVTRPSKPGDRIPLPSPQRLPTVSHNSGHINAALQSAQRDRAPILRRAARQTKHQKALDHGRRVLTSQLRYEILSVAGMLWQLRHSELVTQPGIMKDSTFSASPLRSLMRDWVDVVLLHGAGDEICL